jgi:hypothetical protein
MVDISGKIAQIKTLIDNGYYFTINRARQYGKTTTIGLLEQAVKNEYVVASISFQAIGDESFESVSEFCEMFTELVQEALHFTGVEENYTEQWVDEKITSFKSLSRHITRMCKGKKLVLIIDEVDNASNNRVFVQFLNMLREKYLAKRNSKDHTFHSVILAGVYDIKNIKLKMVSEGKHVPTETENKMYNSPWNIAADFDVDMSFNPDEIATMLTEYEKDHKTGMDVTAMSEEIHSYTSGYPFLVSRICKHIDEKLDRNWTVAGIQQAVKILLFESNTLFDDMFKNLENNKELYALIYDLLILREVKPFVIYDPVIGIGAMYGFLKNVDGSISVANKIFELRIIDYFISKDMRNKRQITGVLQRDVVRDGIFDMELCLRKFAEHYAEIYNKRDDKFIEREGKLMFLSYLKPLINGQGFYHMESQLVDLRRMDIVVDFNQQQFIIELKVWGGQVRHAEAYTQLCVYLDSKHTDTGYLLTFDFRKERNKISKAEWIEVDGKRIFDVMV